MRSAWVVCALLAIGCGDKQAEAEKEREKAEELVREAEEAREEAEEARREADRARKQAEAARKAAVEAQEAVLQLQRDHAAFTKRLHETMDALAGAQTDADREAASKKLEVLRREQAELEQRIAEARAKAARAERTRGVTISPECIENPLAKGCS